MKQLNFYNTQNFAHFKDNYLKIVQDIAQIRKNIPMTQEQMAAWINCSLRTYTNFEAGKTINIQILLCASEKLSIDINIYHKIN
jgi:DNA-binding XRE family transcriptional regulator